MFEKWLLLVAALLMLLGGEAIGAVDHVDFVPKNVQSVDRNTFKKQCLECHAANYRSFDHTKPFTYAGETYFVIGDSMKATNSVDTRQLGLQQYRKAFNTASSSSDLSTFINTYSSDDPDKLVPLARKKLEVAQKREAAEAKKRELQKYHEAFKNARSSSDFDTFIQTYQSKDPDRLIAKAKKMKSEAEKREAAEREESNRRWKADEPRRHHNAMCESNNSVCVSNCEAAASRQDVRYWQCKNDCDRALSRCTQ